MKNLYSQLKKFKKAGLVLLAVVVLGIGVTIAFFTDMENAINRMSTGEVNINTEEDTSDPLTKKDIGIKARGSSTCYVRMRVNVPTAEYQYKDGETEKTGYAVVTDASDVVYPAEADSAKWEELPVDSTIETSVIRAGQKVSAQWKKLGTGDDVYWYLSEPLSPGDSVTLIKEITFPGLLKDGKLVDPLPSKWTKDMLTIPITSDAVQADNIDVGNATGAEAAYAAFQQLKTEQQ